MKLKFIISADRLNLFSSFIQVTHGFTDTLLFNPTPKALGVQGATIHDISQCISFTQFPAHVEPTIFSLYEYQGDTETNDIFFKFQDPGLFIEQIKQVAAQKAPLQCRLAKGVNQQVVLSVQSKIETRVTTQEHVLDIYDENPHLQQISEIPTASNSVIKLSLDTSIVHTFLTTLSTMFSLTNGIKFTFDNIIPQEFYDNQDGLHRNGADIPSEQVPPPTFSTPEGVMTVSGTADDFEITTKFPQLFMEMDPMVFYDALSKTHISSFNGKFPISGHDTGTLVLKPLIRWYSF